MNADKLKNYEKLLTVDIPIWNIISIESRIRR